MLKDLEAGYESTLLTEARRRLLTSQMMAPRAQLMLPAGALQETFHTKRGWGLTRVLFARRIDRMDEYTVRVRGRRITDFQQGPTEQWHWHLDPAPQ